LVQIESPIKPDVPKKEPETAVPPPQKPTPEIESPPATKQEKAIAATAPPAEDLTIPHHDVSFEAEEAKVSETSGVDLCWPYGGERVFVAGTFNEWTQTPLEPGPSGHKVTLQLKPGSYQFKFVVDNNWCYDMQKPIAVENGNTNNILEVS
jgi:hypothetical protein